MRESRADLPERPGVYLFKAGDGRILYIGKAVNLRNRVAHYFQHRHWPVVSALLQQADDVEWIVTADEADALLLEYNLVQQHRPPFNVKLKDDKSFPSIVLTTEEEFPGVYCVRRWSGKGFVFGPLARPARARELIDLLTRLFRIRVCGAAAFRRAVPCLYHHIERCDAPCCGRSDAGAYRKRVEEARRFLRGETGMVLRRLTAEMQRAAEELRFEAAQRLKEEIAAVRGFVPSSYISTPRADDCAVLALHFVGGEAAVLVLTVTGGHIRDSAFFTFAAPAAESEEALAAFLADFYRERPLPPEILVPFLPPQAEAWTAMLGAAGRRTRLHVPQRGRKRRLLEMAEANLAERLRRDDYDRLAVELQERLGLGRPPQVIEAVDISHTQEQERVGAVVVFERGRPRRRDYRNYRIREALAGDTEAIAEVLTRRYSKAESFPDLLLIDGGKPQLGAALAVKRALHLPFDCIALAKEEERVFTEDGRSLVFPADSPLRFLLQNIRDEVHRRAVTHHRRRRERRWIPGS